MNAFLAGLRSHVSVKNELKDSISRESNGFISGISEEWIERFDYNPSRDYSLKGISEEWIERWVENMVNSMEKESISEEWIERYKASRVERTSLLGISEEWIERTVQL